MNKPILIEAKAISLDNLEEVGTFSETFTTMPKSKEDYCYEMLTKKSETLRADIIVIEQGGVKKDQSEYSLKGKYYRLQKK